MIVKLRHLTAGGHVHVTVFVGPNEAALGNAGTLCFRRDEWPRFAQALDAGADAGDFRLIVAELAQAAT